MLAAQSEWAGSWFLKQANAPEFVPDPAFRISPELAEELTEGLPPDREWIADHFDAATSEAHARHLRQEAVDSVDRRQRLASLGYSGLGLQIGAAITDPANVLISLTTGPLGAAGAYGSKANRIQRMLRSGLVAGTSNAAIESYLVSQDPTRDPEDILIALAGGFALGSLAGIPGGRARAAADSAPKATADPELAESARKLQREAILKDAEAQGFTATDKGKAYTEDIPNLDDVLPTPEASDLTPLEFAADGPTARSAFGRIRYDMTAKLKQSKHPTIQRLGNMLAEESVGNADASPVLDSVSEWTRRTADSHRVAFYREAEPAFKEWAKEQGINWATHFRHRNRFYEEVGKAVRQPPGIYTANKAINRAADAMREQHKQFLKIGKQYRIKGFADIPENPQYLMRVHSIRKMDEIRADPRYGDEALQRLVAGSIRAGSDDLTEAQAAHVAEAYLRRINDRSWMPDAMKARLFSQDQAETLEDMLRAELSHKLSEDEIEGIVYTVTKHGVDQTDKIPRARRRMELDESYTDPVSGLSVGDILENNAAVLMDIYSKQITGAAGMRRVYEALDVDGHEGMIRKLTREADELGLDRGQFDSDLRSVDILRKAITGIPLNPDTRGNRVARSLMDFNFIRVMNQVGLAQIPEFGNLIGQAGIRSFMKVVPDFRAMLRRAKDGKLEDELVDELVSLTGIGEERLLAHGGRRLDDYFGVFDGDTYRQTDQLLEQGKRITADASLMAPINMVLQRASLKAAAQRFGDMAIRGKIDINDRRLASLGLTPEDTQAILKQIKKHSRLEDSGFGKGHKLARLNLDEWSDQGAAAKLTVALDRFSRRVVQQNDIGNLPPWMTPTLGRILTQFRSFMAVSWAKQFLHGIHTRDMETFTAWSASMMLAGLTYTGQQYLNSVGRKDAKKYRDERLTATEIGKAAFQRAGFAALFPAAVDTVLGFAAYDPVFAYGRTTGLATDLLSGNPTAELATRAQGAARGVIAAGLRSDYDYSQEDARQLRRVLPFQNLYGINNTLEKLTGGLPEKPE